MPRKKKITDDEEELDQEEELEWDKKKIAIALIILIILIAGLVFSRPFIFGESKSVSTQKSVQGITTQNTSLLPSEENVKKQINAVQDKISKLSVKDIASSSPQVQQILHELQSLPKSPGDTIKQACVKLCNGL